MIASDPLARAEFRVFVFSAPSHSSMISIPLVMNITQPTRLKKVSILLCRGALITQPGRGYKEIIKSCIILLRFQLYSLTKRAIRMMVKPTKVPEVIIIVKVLLSPRLMQCRIKQMIVRAFKFKARIKFYCVQIWIMSCRYN